MTYRVYLRTFDGAVSEKTVTSESSAAMAAFAGLVNRREVDGQKMAAALTYNNRQLAFHRFDRHPGQADYWRDKLDSIEWPPGAEAAAAGWAWVNIRLDDDTLAAAIKIGDGCLATGITTAIRQAADAP